ncbi:putative metal-dependent enzyme (double-stranded beta helix superfamily) [Novosphingobium hassiacum]|uniref:Putative metal-dependent enzyme (Double-stranded beta helix superfamily) n=1 Tax=Novosphingobium hassiacum TaxID=173676 RepID=A0A7W5ZVP8_9SPHN|nr:cysteine dioxygenase [Novosphingobium hassiacum]MBB3859319.1 putative metal-dependent enzyme (double-stranded beta helix superfamily) [Novosphingobium hassiacum]
MSTLSAPAFLTGPGIARLRQFVESFSELLSSTEGESEILQSGSKLLARLIAHDDWLPAVYAQPDPERYRQYLLHCDSRERFSVVSFVWGPGQGTPIHDHRTWGLIGMLRGSERSERFEMGANGELRTTGPPDVLFEGEVEKVSPTIGDIHRVNNASADQASISIHVYGGNIGVIERATYTIDGTEKRFVSGYANSEIPNVWNHLVTS